eukprot:3103952-Karenia_brevis.AAC.1
MYAIKLGGEKLQMAHLCHFEFPCEGVPVPPPMCDLADSPCPKGWELIGTKIPTCHGVNYKVG